jgi:hypothetical protein
MVQAYTRGVCDTSLGGVASPTMPDGDERAAIRDKLNGELKRVMEVHSAGADMIAWLPPPPFGRFGFYIVKQQVCSLICAAPDSLGLDIRIEGIPGRIDGTMVAALVEQMRAARNSAEPKVNEKLPFAEPVDLP